MGKVAGPGSVAIASQASVNVPVQAGPISQWHGSLASWAVPVGCSPTCLTPASLGFPLADASGCGRTGSRFPVRLRSDSFATAADARPAQPA
jgi:hypothetical protein